MIIFLYRRVREERDVTDLSNPFTSHQDKIKEEEEESRVVIVEKGQCGSSVIDDIYITNVGIPIVLNCRLLPPLDTVINHKHGVQSDIVSFLILNTDTVLIHSSCISN